MSDLLTGIFSTMGSGPKVFTGVKGSQLFSSKSQDNSQDVTNKPKENRITRKKIKENRITRKKIKEKKVNLKNVFEELFDLPDESILVYDAEKQAKLEEEQKKKEIEEKEKNDIIAKRQQEISQLTASKGDELPVTIPTSDDTSGKIITNEDGTMVTSDGTEVTLDEKGNYVSPSGEIVDVSKIPSQRSMSQPENKFTFSEEITTEQRNLVESCVNQLQTVLANPEVSSSIITTDDDEDGDPNAVKIIEKTIDDKGESQTSQNIFIDPAVPDFQ